MKRICEVVLVMMVYGLSACASAQSQCLKEVRDVYTTDGGAGWGSIVRVPVYRECQSQETSIGQNLTPVSDIPNYDNPLYKEKWEPVLRPVPGEPVVLPSGIAFDLQRIPDPWFLERPLTYGDDPEAPIRNTLYITAPVSALELVGEALSPARRYSKEFREQRYVSVTVYWPPSVSQDSMDSQSMEYIPFVAGASELDFFFYDTREVSDYWKPVSNDELLKSGRSRFSFDSNWVRTETQYDVRNQTLVLYRKKNKMERGTLLSEDRNVMCTMYWWDWDELETDFAGLNPYSACFLRGLPGGYRIHFTVPSRSTTELPRMIETILSLLDEITI